MLAGDNSILQKATTAKENTERAEIVENAKMDVLSEITKNKGNDLQESQLKDVLKEYFINSEIPEELPSDLSTLELTTLDNKYKIKVSEIYDGTFTKVSKSTGKTVAELYDGKNNPNEENYNENAMHIGDWVEYDAGIWTETKELADWENPFTFGGYTSGQSRNTNANGIEAYNEGQYEGWRIFDISESAITLISAGCPEGFYDMNTNGANYNSEKVLTGSTTGYIEEGYTSTPRDWSIYENTYANSNTATSIKLSDLNQWYNKYIDGSVIEIEEGETSFPSISSNKLISLIRNGYYYTLPEKGNYGYQLFCGNGYISSNDGEDDGNYGVRVLLKLKNDITFNETTTKLQKDGFTYNKWIISE